MPHQIHQMLPTLTYGDAIGNYALALRSLFREWGYESQIYAERWHPRLAKDCLPFQEYKKVSHPDNLVLLHYSIGGEINEYALSLAEQVVVCYHNITPPHFFYSVNGELARQLHDARRHLASIAGQAPAIADSLYNAQELEEMGFDVLGVTAPVIGTLERLAAQVESAQAAEIRRRYEDGDMFDWLCLGRISPNKCVHDVINAFYYYHTWIRSTSRLFIVGTGEGLEPYVDSLHDLVSQLGLDGAVIFAGHCDDEALPAFYDMADVYINLSEHEGFGVPLLESMSHELPIIAHAVTAVPYVLGDAGVHIHQKDPAIIAEIVHELEINETLRRQIIDGQRRRLEAFSTDKAKAQMRTCLHSYLNVAGE
ncbi:MAG: glycosyltransferase family 4 protein [Caldilineaceae bacterium]|nr:glycosyltransferase family 4 protein [Caldilineaceae bacterium]